MTDDHRRLPVGPALRTSDLAEGSLGHDHARDVPLAIGAAVAAAAVVPWLTGHASLVDVLLVVGMAVVVPLGLPLASPEAARPWRRPAGRAFHMGRRWQPLAAALAAIGVARAPTTDLVLGLGMTWVVVAGLLVGDLASEVRHLRSWRRDDIARAGALAYLLVGAGWTVLHVAGAQPMDFDVAIVELTGVHFHFAGFGALLIAREVATATAPSSPRLAGVAVWATLAGPPITAIGFTASPPLQVVGAMVMTTGVWATSWLTLRHVVPATADRQTSWSLTVSGLAVWVPMLLALQWAAGQVWDVPRLSIPAMAASHGVLNALGFTVLGLWGWRRLR